VRRVFIFYVVGRRARRVLAASPARTRVVDSRSRGAQAMVSVEHPQPLNVHAALNLHAAAEDNTKHIKQIAVHLVDLFRVWWPPHHEHRRQTDRHRVWPASDVVDASCPEQ
jgi:hypothetical protein